MRFGVVICMGLAVGACRIQNINVSQKTALERQLIGELTPLDPEEALEESVRAQIEASGNIALSSKVLRARQRQLFNRDDVDEFKDKGCLGEAKGARLVVRPCSAPEGSLIEKIASEESTDRQTIIDWAILRDPVLTPAQRSEVITLYREMVREESRPGHWWQNENDEWVQIQ